MARDDDHPPAGCRFVVERAYPGAWGLALTAVPEFVASTAGFENAGDFPRRDDPTATRALARALERENEELEARIAKLGRGYFGRKTAAERGKKRRNRRFGRGRGHR